MATETDTPATVTYPASPALNPETPLRKNTRVRNLNRKSSLFGARGTVIKATALRIHVKWDDIADPIEHPKTEDFDIYAEQDLSEYLEAYIEGYYEQGLRYEVEYKRRREIEEREKYAELRRNVFVPVFASQPSWGNEGIEYGYESPGSTYRRRLIEVNMTPSAFMGVMPRVECVNWSSIGSVTPEFALAFAEALKHAAQHAIEERSKREAALGITI